MPLQALSLIFHLFFTGEVNTDQEIGLFPQLISKALSCGRQGKYRDLDPSVSSVQGGCLESRGLAWDPDKAHTSKSQNIGYLTCLLIARESLWVSRNALGHLGLHPSLPGLDLRGGDARYGEGRMSHSTGV